MGISALEHGMQPHLAAQAFSQMIGDLGIDARIDFSQRADRMTSVMQAHYEVKGEKRVLTFEFSDIDQRNRMDVLQDALRVIKNKIREDIEANPMLPKDLVKYSEKTNRTDYWLTHDEGPELPAAIVDELMRIERSFGATSAGLGQLVGTSSIGLNNFQNTSSTQMAQLQNTMAAQQLVSQQDAALRRLVD